MNARRTFATAVGLLFALLLIACQSQVVTHTVEVTRIVGGPVHVEGEEVVVTQVVTEIQQVVVTAEPVGEELSEEPFPQPPPTNMTFEEYGTNPFIDAGDDNLSTFAIDVDTGAYTIMRGYLTEGSLPPDEAVRVEEFINYFDQDYPSPETGAFAIHLEGVPTPYGESDQYRLVRVGIQGYTVDPQERADALLIFVVDVSGSMDMENRLGLVKESLRMMLYFLRPTDRVGIVAYGSNARVVLEPTPVDSRYEILSAIDELQPEGSTNAEEGLWLAYQMAEAFAQPGQIHRLILCSDGVANVGNTTAETILRHAENGISLSTFGFGMGNYNDALMEQLADQGDGAYAYIDTYDEAERVFSEQLTSTIVTIAQDAKVQVVFNPAVVERYRLLGYENRAVADEDFRDETVDAGEIGAGHSVTALYEIKLSETANPEESALTVQVRYTDPQTGDIHEMAESIAPNKFAPSFESASSRFQLNAVVAEFAEILKGSFWAQENNLTSVAFDARRVAEYFPDDRDVQEFANLVWVAAGLQR